MDNDKELQRSKEPSFPNTASNFRQKYIITMGTMDKFKLSKHSEARTRKELDGL